jgi:hypothetical protein
MKSHHFGNMKPVMLLKLKDGTGMNWESYGQSKTTPREGIPKK